jgi:hypothetical protein
MQTILNALTKDNVNKLPTGMSALLNPHVLS